MSNRLIILVLTNVITFNIGLFGLVHKSKHKELPPVAIQEPQYTPIPEYIPPPMNYDISDPVPAYKNYSETWAQLQAWDKQCPDLVEVGTYGKSSRGTDLHWIKIENEHVRTLQLRPVVLITACIHGNEPLSASTVMGYIGTILDKYGDDEKITALVDNRIIYFVPVVSPDSYPNRRHVDGVDPNRNFPGPRNPNKRSVSPVLAIQNLFKRISPNAVISGHTYGRVYLTPYGDRRQRCPNDDDYDRIIGEMGSLSQYRVQRACEMYNSPIYGTEVDWYYRNGAFATTPNRKRIHRGAFAIVMEFGTHQHIPSQSDIDSEFRRTFQAVLYFIKEAPLVEIWWSEDGQPVNQDGTLKWMAYWKQAA